MKTNVLVLALFQTAIVSPLAQPQPGAKLWSFDTGDEITTSPALGSDGTVYVASPTVLYAITNAGSNRWTYALSDRAAGSPGVATDGTLYVVIGADSTSALVAIGPDGSLKWTYRGDALGGSPAIGVDGTIYVGGVAARALSNNGTCRWTNYVATASPAIGTDGTIYTGSAALRPDGSLKWTVSLGSPLSDSPAVGTDGSSYVASVGLYAFSGTGGALWVNTASNFYKSCPALGMDGTVYVSTLDGGALCAVGPTGDLRWSTPLGQGSFTNSFFSTKAPAIDVSGTIYFPGYQSLSAVGSDGKLLWSFRPGDGSAIQTSPTVGRDGTIYISFGSKLYALAGTNSLADSPWPMYRQNARHTGKVEKPSLQQPQKRSDANFQFELYAQQLGQTYTVESSTNLTGWTSLTSFVATTLPMDVVDLSASNSPAKFYRAFSPP